MKKTVNLKLLVIIGIVIAVIVIGVLGWLYVYPTVAMVSMLSQLDEKMQAATSVEEAEEFLIEFLKDPAWGPICFQAENELTSQQEKMKEWVESGKDYRAYPDNDILPDLLRISQLCAARDPLP